MRNILLLFNMQTSHNNAFYRGVLAELNKVATSGMAGEGLGNAGASVVKPAAPIAPPPAQAPITTPHGTNYTPNANPGQPVQVNNTRQASMLGVISDKLDQFSGSVDGKWSNFSVNHPTASNWTGGLGYVGRAMHDKATAAADDRIANTSIFDKSNFGPGSGENVLKPNELGFFQGDKSLQSHVQQSLQDKTLGAATLNPETNNIDKDYSKVPGYLVNKAEGWMGQHPWLTGIGGGIGLMGILAMLLNRGGDNPQQPQQPQQPGFAPGQLPSNLNSPKFTQ